jgi:phosphate acetyltransferase
MPEAGLASASSVGSAAQIPISKYDRLIATAKRVPSAKAVVVHPCDETSLRGAAEAAQLGLIDPLLVGPEVKIRQVAHEHRIDIAKFELASAAHSHAAAAKAVELIRAGQGDLLMKGSLHTDELMRAVTASGTGLRTERRISHVFVMDVPTYAETLFLTDAAVNIFPDLDAKRDIVQNAIDLFTAIGLGTPRVAILSPVETVTAKIPATIDARRSARWPTVARSPVPSSMARSPLIMRSTRKPPG